MKILNLIIGIIIVTSVISIKADCNTPVDCYNKAIDALHQAREEYQTTKDKLIALLDQINIDDLTKIIGAQNNTNTSFTNRINYLEQIFFNATCRIALSKCYDESLGFIWLFKNQPGCNGDEFMRGWGLQNCNTGQIGIYNDCCKHP
jgi:uncharacterized membrane protein